MGRGWRPILVGAAVVVGTFALAQGAGLRARRARGERGGRRETPPAAQTVFERECAGCHGTAGTGGGVGPALAEQRARRRRR